MRLVKEQGPELLAEVQARTRPSRPRYLKSRVNLHGSNCSDTRVYVESLYYVLGSPQMRSRDHLCQALDERLRVPVRGTRSAPAELRK